MKQRHFKALTSLLLVVVMLASMLPAIPVTVNAADEQTYVKVNLADIQPTDVVIIVATILPHHPPLAQEDFRCNSCPKEIK